MTEVEQLRQEIIAELDDIAPETMEEALALIRQRKAEDEDEREAQIAREEARVLGTTSLSDLRKELGL